MRIRSRAFTLIELLVVVAILALLMAILLPSLNRARDRAKSVGCLLNLKNIGIAFASYIEVSDGIIPLAQIQNTAFSTPKFNQTGWCNLLEQTGGLRAPAQNTSDLTSSTGSSLLRCPAGENMNLSVTGMWVPVSKTDPAANGFWRYNLMDTSGNIVNALDTWYGINGHNFGSTGSQGYVALPFQKIPRDGNGYSSRYERHRNWPSPQDLAVLYDGFLYAQSSNNALTTNRIQARHVKNTKVNILLADWHAEAYDGDILPTTWSWSTASDLNANPRIINPNGCYQLGGPRWSLRQDEGVP